MELLDKAKQFLLSLEDVKKETPCVIIIQGNQVKLPSGKSAWKNKRAARSALTNCIYGNVDYKHATLLRKMLEDEGFVTIKEFKF